MEQINQSTRENIMRKILLLMGFSVVMLTSLPGQARVFVAEPGVVVVAPRPTAVYVEPRLAPVIVAPAAPVVVAPRPAAVYVAPATAYVEPRPVIVGGPVVRRWVR